MGTYVEQADLEAVWGVDSIDEWSNLESASPAVAQAARIAQAIAWAEDYLHSRLRKGPYVIPIAGNLLLIDVVARYAGWWLYLNRGLESGDDTDRVKAVVKWAESIVDKILSGVLVLEAPKVSRTATAPMVVS